MCAGSLPRDLALLLGSWGDLCIRANRLPEAKALILESRDLLQELGDVHSCGSAIMMLGVVSEMEKDPQRALDYLEEARSMLDKDSPEMSNCINVMSGIYQSLGNFENHGQCWRNLPCR